MSTTPRRPAPIAAVDCETTGLGPNADIWEFYGLRRNPAPGTDEELHLFIQHDELKCYSLPESFKQQHFDRWPSHGQGTVTPVVAARMIEQFLGQKEGQERVHIVGAVPAADTAWIEVLLRKTGRITGDKLVPWSHHLIDVEALAIGYLRAKGVTIVPPWSSDDLFALIDVEPPTEEERHTAKGDALWAMRIYDHIMGGES